MSEMEARALAKFYDANIGLLKQVNALAQRSGQEWSDQRKQAIAAIISDASAELSELQEIDGALPWAVQTKIVRNHWERRQRAMQDLFHSISGNAALTGELAAAFRDWYCTITALALVDGMSHVTSPWISYLSQFQPFWQSIPAQTSSSIDESSSDLD